MKIDRNNLPLVSVCIPAYNHENYVQETIKSIIAQTYKNIELIIIDDGSTDSTFSKIKEMENICKKRFRRVVFETKQNEGTCDTVNKIYSLANGEFIYHIASDDMAKPNAIETEIKFLSNNPEYALVVGDNDIIDSNGNRCYWDKERNNVYTKKDAVYKTFGAFLKHAKPQINFCSDDFGTYKSLFIGNYIPNGYMIRKSVLGKIGPFTQKAPLEDWWFMLQISKYYKIKYIDRILFSYRWHGTNTIKQTDKMEYFTAKTKEHEIDVLKQLKKSKFDGCLPDVKQVYKQQARKEFKRKYNIHQLKNYFLHFLHKK